MQPTTISLDNDLGAFMKEYHERLSPILGRIIFYISIILSLIMVILFSSGKYSQMIFINPQWMGLIPVFLITGTVFAVGIYLSIKNYFIIAPFVIKAYEKGFIYQTFVNRTPQKVKWDQVVSTNSKEFKTNWFTRTGNEKYYEIAELNYIVKFDNGKIIDFNYLTNGEDLYDIAYKHQQHKKNK